MRTKDRALKGLTLVEVMITVTLFSIFAAALARLLVASYHCTERTKYRTSQIRDLNIAVETMRRELHHRSLTSDSLAASYPFAGTTSVSFTPVQTKALRYRYYAADQSGASPEEREVAYYLDATSGLFIREQGTEKRAVAKSLQGVVASLSWPDQTLELSFQSSIHKSEMKFFLAIAKESGL